MVSNRRKTARSENLWSSNVTAALPPPSEPEGAGQSHRVQADFSPTVAVLAGEQLAVPDMARSRNVVLIAEIEPELLPAIPGARGDGVLHDHAGQRRQRRVRHRA